MNTNDAIRMMEDPMMTLRTYLDRARYTMQDINESFFEMQIDVSDKKEWWKLANGFQRNSVRAEIVDDALSHVFSALNSLEKLYEQMTQKEGAA